MSVIIARSHYCGINISEFFRLANEQEKSSAIDSISFYKPGCSSWEYGNKSEWEEKYNILIAAMLLRENKP